MGHTNIHSSRVAEQIVATTVKTQEIVLAALQLTLLIDFFYTNQHSEWLALLTDYALQTKLLISVESTMRDLR